MTEGQCQFRPKPKGNFLPSAETETMPKEAIFQLSAPKPKPKPNFGRPLMYMCVYVCVYICVYVCVYMYACMYVYVCMHNIWGNCPRGKCPTQNGRENCPGGGELSGGRVRGIVRGNWPCT